MRPAGLFARRREEHAVGQARARIARRHQQRRGAVAEAIARRLRAAAPREDQRPQQPADRADREVAQRARQRGLDLVDRIVEGPREQRTIARRTPFVLVTLEHAAGDVELAQHVAQTARQRLLELQLAAEQQHRGVGHQRQRGRVAIELAIEAARVVVARRLAELRAGQAEPPGCARRWKSRSRCGRTARRRTCRCARPDRPAARTSFPSSPTDGTGSRPGRRSSASAS